MLAEDHLPGSNVGPVLNAMIRNQFLRLMDGDRFFYTGDPFLQSPEVKAILDIDDVTLGNVIAGTQRDRTCRTTSSSTGRCCSSRPRRAAPTSRWSPPLGVVTIIEQPERQRSRRPALRTVERRGPGRVERSNDVFNLFIATANGGIEDGVLAFGRGGTGDRLNVFGRPLINDTFTVTNTSFSTGSVTGLRRGGGNPADNAITLAVAGRDVDVNGNDLLHSGSRRPAS